MKRGNWVTAHPAPGGQVLRHPMTTEDVREQGFGAGSSPVVGFRPAKAVVIIFSPVR